MTAIAADSYDLRRWVLSAAVVIGLHAALVVRLTTWHEPVPGDEGTEAIIVDLAPLTAPPTDSRNDLAPGPEQQQSKAAQDVQQPEQTPQEKIEPPPPVPDAEVKLPEEVKPAEKRAQGRPWRRSLHGIAELPNRSRDTKAIRLLPARDTRPAPHNSPLRSIATERLLRAASCGRRGRGLSIRKQSIPCGARSPSRRRRRTCPVTLSTSPSLSTSTFAETRGGTS